MAWKKAWPTPIKQDLKKKGVSDADIKLLESCGSLAKLKELGTKKALKDALINQLIKQLNDEKLV